MLPAVLKIALILPFGEPREGFFDDTVLGLLGARARAGGHEATALRVYYDGSDPARDAEIRERVRAWLDARDVDLVVVERLFDPAPVEGRRLVQVTRGDSVDPIEGVDLVLGASAGTTHRGSTRTPGPGGLERAFAELLARLRAGADPLEVPGVARPGEPARAPLEPAPLPDPFAPLVDHEIIALDEAPRVVRKTVYGNLGCPYAADPMKNPRFEGVRLPTLPLARLGCAFCSMGGDYEKRPDAEVVAEVVRQARYYAEALPELEELLLNDQHSLRYLAELMRATSELRPLRWLFAARADAFVRETERVRAAIDAARAAGHRLEVYLSGFEAFNDETLQRYNKGVRTEELLRAVDVMRELHREAPGVFDYARTRGHSLILYDPWTTPEQLRDSAERIRSHGLTELFDELGRNRLRLYADLPITYLAQRDGALAEDWDEGDEGAGRRKGYNVERPWRFLDERTRAAHRAASSLREALGAETEVAQLLAVTDPEVALDPDALPDALAAMEQGLSRLLAHERGPDDPPRGAQTRASVALFAGVCNNGCRACANRDAWLDDRPEAVAARVTAARAHGRPVVLAGREPTMHPAFLELVALARGEDERPVGIVTNGRRFAYERFARAAIARGLRAASVKLFAPAPEAADAISRDPGGFAQAAEGLAHLGGRCATEIRAPLHRANLERYADYAELAARLGADQLRIELALDAVGVDRLAEAAAAIERLRAACAERGLALEASPLRAGTRAFGWMPAQPR